MHGRLYLTGVRLMVKVLHVLTSVAAQWGGATSAAVSLCEGLAQKGVQCHIFAPDFPKGGQQLHPQGVGVSLFTTGFLARWWKGYSPSLAKALSKAVQDFDLVHIHELWHYPHLAAYQAAIRWKKPYIITLHGGLEPWAFGYKGTKKRVYMRLVQRRILKKAGAIHALTPEEEREVRRLGLRTPVMLIPNGIHPRDFRDLPARTELESSYPELEGKRVVLFLSRIHPKKGLDLLAKALGRIVRQPEGEDVHLVIAGPDEGGYQAKVESMLKGNGVFDKTTFTGMLTGRNKLAALARADLFVLPSYSEGFSVATLEALACGLPTVITHQCYFPEVGKSGAGEIIQPDADELTVALKKLMDAPDLRRHMGERARRLVLERYTWDQISGQMLELYCTVRC